MKRNRVSLLFLSAIVLFALTGTFAKIMTSLSHNEHMYITASVLVAQNKIMYKDFAYVQMPYLPLLYGGLYRLLNINSYYLLTGKMISFLSLFISATVLFIIARRVLKNDINLSLGITALFLLNTSIVDPSMEVSNYIMPVAFSLASFALFDISIENSIKPFGIAVAGFFLAIAIGIKLTYATIAIPFVIASLLYPLMTSKHSQTIFNKRTIIIYILLPFVAGIVIGLLPMLFYLSDVKSFIFNNLGYHNLNAQWRQNTEHVGPMSLIEKLGYARDIFFQPNNLILMLGVLLGIVLFIHKDSRTIKQAIEEEMTKGALLAFILFLIAIPTALAPTPSFPQYFAIPISFLFLLLIYTLAPKSSLETSMPQIGFLHKKLLITLVLVSVIYNSLSFGKSIYDLLDRNSWSGIYVHDVSLKIRNTLIHNGVDINRKIATLSPLYIIEANLPVYSELSTGPFTYRIGDLLNSKDQKHFVVTSPNSTSNLFNEDKPVAIFVGFEGDLDKPFIEYAMSHDYKKVNGFFGGGKLYIINIGVP